MLCVRLSGADEPPRQKKLQPQRNESHHLHIRRSQPHDRHPLQRNARHAHAASLKVMFIVATYQVWLPVCPRPRPRFVFVLLALLNIFSPLLAAFREIVKGICRSRKEHR